MAATAPRLLTRHVIGDRCRWGAHPRRYGRMAGLRRMAGRRARWSILAVQRQHRQPRGHFGRATLVGVLTWEAAWRCRWNAGCGRLQTDVVPVTRYAKSGEVSIAYQAF